MPAPSLHSVPVVAPCWGSPACFVPGRKAARGGDAATPSTPRLFSAALGSTAPVLGKCWGTAHPLRGPNMALHYRRTRRAWHRRCLTASSTARACPFGASKRPAAIPGPLRSPRSLRPRPGSSSGMRVRRRGQRHAGSRPGWRGQSASAGVGLGPPGTSIPSLSRRNRVQRGRTLCFSSGGWGRA